MSPSYSSFAEWAAAQNTQKVYAVETSGIKLADDSTISIFACSGHKTEKHNYLWDGTHNFSPCVLAIPRVRHMAQEFDGGESFASYGTLIFGTEKNRAIDTTGTVTWNGFIKGYSFAGRPVVIKIGGQGLDYSKWRKLQGYLGSPTKLSDLQLEVPVFSEAKEVFEKEIPPNTYDNSFPDDTEGQPKPLAFGELKNITPVLIDDTGFVYQVHDPAIGGIQSFDAVYVNGKQVTSGFTANTTQNTIDFSSDPQGSVTCDIHGSVLGGTYSALPGDIIKFIIQSVLGIDAEKIDSAAFTAYNTAVPYDVAIYCKTMLTAKTIIRSLISGLRTTWGTTRAGLYTIKRFGAPMGSSTLSLDKKDIIDIDMPSEQRIYWKVNVKGDRNWSLTTRPDDTVSVDRRQWLKEQFRERVASDSNIQARFGSAAKNTTFETHLVNLIDCETVAADLLSLMGTVRRRPKITAKMKLAQLDMVDEATITYDRWGLENGQDMTVVGMEEIHSLDPKMPSKIVVEGWF